MVQPSKCWKLRIILDQFGISSICFLCCFKNRIEGCGKSIWIFFFFGSVYIFFNGYEKKSVSSEFWLDSSSFMWFHYRSNSSFDSIVLDDCNNVEILFVVSDYDPKKAKITIERCRAHVACICPSRNLVVDKMACISVRTYVFHLLRTYVMILCNWLILWQNALYLYLGRFRMF